MFNFNYFFLRAYFWDLTTIIREKDSYMQNIVWRGSFLFSDILSFIQAWFFSHFYNSHSFLIALNHATDKVAD